MSVDDQPGQHGITDSLVERMLSRFLDSGTDEFSVSGYKYWSLATFGEGYTTTRKVLDITYQLQGDKEDRHALLIVKLPVGAFSDMMRDLGLYEREVIVYSEILEFFRELLQRRDRHVQLPFPRFLYGRLRKDGVLVDDLGSPITGEGLEEMLAIEKLDEYEVIDKKVGFDEAHLRMTMSAVGRLHACGYVLVRDYPRKAERLRQVRQQMPTGVERMAEFYQPMVELLRHHGRCQEAGALKHLVTYDSFSRLYQETFSRDQPVLTLLHGDLWTGNVMFKYEKGTDGRKRPVDLRFVDLQMARFGAPAYDLVYVLFTSTTRDIRRRLLQEVLRWYEEAFRQQLVDLGQEPDLVAPWLTADQLMKMYAKTVPFGFLNSSYVVTLLFCSDDERSELMTSEVEEGYTAAAERATRWGSGGCTPELTSRLLALADDLHQFGYI